MSLLLPVVGPDNPALHSIISVQKAKVKDGQLSCEFTEQRAADATRRAFALTCHEQVHPDLLHALTRLVPHLCLLTEQLHETPDFWPDEAEELPTLFRSFAVTGFSLSKDSAGITLIGRRELAGGKVLNLTSPHVAFDDETSGAYSYAGLLETAAQQAVAEVEAALRGKCAPDRQLLLSY
ncbi:hypothetical protein [Hymenobacter jeollabukensis]|uniref:Uncharacterized protein n=1 Tax=Hymenobacter jeollabukensis TaxID=2025313 RepID=A0A5R8WKB5_9BACT|nr:hypothetical protein [Hymenobacter jeollabukensis]TLM89373.1 hypothetical protein FDY95_20075 [Hymenobacter jeollabukensis]